MVCRLESFSVISKNLNWFEMFISRWWLAGYRNAVKLFQPNNNNVGFDFDEFLIIDQTVWFISEFCRAIMTSFISLCLLNASLVTQIVQCLLRSMWYLYLVLILVQSILKSSTKTKCHFMYLKSNQPKVLLNENFEHLRTIEEFICEIKIWVICKLNFPKRKKNWIQFETFPEIYCNQTNTQN